MQQLSPWFLQKGFPQGTFWALLTAFISVSNDVITKSIGSRLPMVEVTFLRFFFSLLTLAPFLMKLGFSELKTKAPFLHGLRAIIGAAAIGLFIWSIQLLKLPVVTISSFTQPLFFMPLAILLLGEKVGMGRLLSTILGFCGIIVLLLPDVFREEASFNIYMLIPMGSAFLFAMLDILAKKMVSKEHTLALLFYFSFGTTLFAAPFAFSSWVWPTYTEWMLLFILGGGANLIQVCLFRAFAAADASSLVPFRYVELIFSAAFGAFLFGEFMTLQDLLGGSIIIASCLLLWKKERTS